MLSVVRVRLHDLGLEGTARFDERCAGVKNQSVFLAAVTKEIPAIAACDAAPLRFSQ